MKINRDNLSSSGEWLVSRLDYTAAVYGHNIWLSFRTWLAPKIDMVVAEDRA